MTALFVASTGGHLAQLVQLEPRLEGLRGDPLWVTFDTPQSRSLLSDRDVVFARHTYSRDYRAVARNGALAARLLRERDVTDLVSTGAAIALSFIPLARAHGVPCHFIESAARSDGPSLTGRLLGAIPGTRLYTQYSHLADGRWEYAGSVFDRFAPAERSTSPRLRRAVVTLGTIGKYGFRRLIERLVRILPPEMEVLWQTDQTDATGLGIDSRRLLPAPELQSALREADVVIAQAGVGSALAALEAGRCPVLVPRRHRYGEHVDDHQEQIAGQLGARGLSVTREADELSYADLVAAAARCVVRREPPPIRLQG